MTLRTTPAICMGPTGNIQGSIKFMCLESGKKIVRRSYSRLPMTESATKKVEKLAEREKAESGINFKDQNKEIFYQENEDYDVINESTVQEIAPYPDIATEFPGIEIEKEGLTSTLNADNGINENEEAANSERNCDLGELPRQNETVAKGNDLIIEGDPDELNMIEVVKEPTNQEIQEEITEILDQDDWIINIENEVEENIEIEEEEITGVNKIQEIENDIELGQGRRKKARNR